MTITQATDMGRRLAESGERPPEPVIATMYAEKSAMLTAWHRRWRELHPEWPTCVDCGACIREDNATGRCQACRDGDE